jgi:Tfp pilus assembly protein PilO
VNWLLRPDRLWAFGAITAAVVLAVLAWMLLIGPQREKTVAAEGQTADAEAQSVVEQRKLNKLKLDYERRDTFAAELAANRRALPSEAATADLLRELQTAGDQAGVSVTSLTAGNPVELSTTGARVASVTITINATGKLSNLQTFLNQIQRIQPRAMLVSDVGIAPGEGGESVSGAARLTVSAQVFVAVQSTTASPSAIPSAAD